MDILFLITLCCDVIHKINIPSYMFAKATLKILLKKSKIASYMFAKAARESNT